MATLEGITIEIDARVRDAKEGLEDVQEEALELSGALEITDASAERAEDSIEEVGDSATQTGASFSGATVSIFGFNASLSTMVGIAAIATPALAALSAAAIGVVGALGAVGGAFATLGLAAVVTNFSKLRSEAVAAIPQIKEAIEPLGEVFTPVLIDAIRDLPALFENIVSSINKAVDLDRFARTLERTIGIVFSILPPLAATMFKVAEAALPLLNQGLMFLRDNGDEAFGVISEATNEVLPELIAFGGAVIDLLPELVGFGTTVLDTLLPPLTALVDTISVLLGEINKLPDGLVQAGLAAGGLAAVLSKVGVLGTGGLIAGGGAGGAAAGGLAGLSLSTLAGGALAVGVTTFLGAKAVEDFVDSDDPGEVDPGAPITGESLMTTTARPDLTADRALLDPKPQLPSNVPNRSEMLDVPREPGSMNITIKELNAQDPEQAGQKFVSSVESEVDSSATFNTTRASR